MSNLEVLIVGGICGFLGCLITAVMNYRNLNRLYTSLGVEIEKAENDLADDIRRVGTSTLEQTSSGIELLKLMPPNFRSKLETEVSVIDRSAELETKLAIRQAELEAIKAGSETEREEILNHIYLQKIELERQRKYLGLRVQEFAQIMEVVSHQLASGYPLNPAVMKTMTELLDAYKEEPIDESQSPLPNHGTSTRDKVETLKNTLLSLLNTKK